ncbi:hypothetical protein Anas_02870 [Armadillidium nasatum]|uniref:Uncharacterized protein n=1 Tax=Armadillidium nasatum TaxID=96803 RepID=A0A5N5SL12_9CRUS|nr:hypothetical protein Anas_02870 [Armadillidium nasatum]
MKSFKDSLRFSRNISSIDGMPKPAVGILTHHEDLALNNLWLDIMKSEEAFGRLSIEAGKYCYTLKEIQGTEEKLLKLLGDSNIAVHSPELRIIIDEYLSVIVEVKKYSDEASNTAHEVLGSTPEQYRLLYEDVNTFRKKRDLLVSEIEKCQDRLDRLKLKGKRTTDVLVEKERNVRQLRDLHSKLLTEAEKFHNLRIKCLQCAVEASVHNQINYYGSTTQEFSKYINQNKDGQHPMRERQYLDTVGSHLDKIRMLTIVDES